MIIYDLLCENQHAFEGWFHDTGDFADQIARNLVQCPVCSSASVRRVPSPVALSGERSCRPDNASSRDGVSVPISGTHMIAAFRHFSRAMRALTEDVGSEFAETARRMHYEEIPERPIRGQATDDEYAELEDEGIPVMRVPVFHEDDLN